MLKKPVYCKNLYPDAHIGDHSYGRIRILGDHSNVTIGKFCSLADGTTFLSSIEHRTDWPTTYPFPALWKEAEHIKGHPATKGPIVVGNDVWIGLGVFVLSGVMIGDGAIIGAGAVVAKDVPPYAVVAGNPARVVSYRFTPHQIELFMKIKWWNWPLEEISSQLDFLLSPVDDDRLQALADKVQKRTIQ